MPELQDNYRIAKKRFEGLKKRLKDVTLYSKYNEVVQDYLQRDMAEDVPKDNTPIADNVKYYLPHHAVLREDKVMTKLRVVFDASSHEDGCLSFNDCLLTGPNLNADIPSRERQRHREISMAKGRKLRGAACRLQAWTSASG